MKVPTKNIRHYLKIAYEVKGLTYPVIARRAGITQAELNAIKTTGETNELVIDRLALFFGITPYDLTHGAKHEPIF